MSAPSYDEVPNFNDRIRLAYTAARAAGAGIEKAQSLIAVSTVESSVIWARNRASAAIIKVGSCWPSISMVGLETASQGKLRFKRADAPGMTKWLANRGWLKETSDGSLYPAGGMSAGPGNRAIAAFLEAVIATRSAKLLANFSLGATQQWLAHCGMADNSVGAKGVGPRKTWPITWEALVSRYVVTDVGKTLVKTTYLDPGVAGAPAYPAGAPSDDERGWRWLVFQAGNEDSAKAYWFPPSVAWTGKDGKQKQGTFNLKGRLANVINVTGSK